GSAAMSLFVVDSSVGMKWFVPEIHSAHALRLQDPSHHLATPAFFDVEMTNILWKKRQRAELTRAEADAILRQLPLLPVSRHAEAPLLPAAFDLAELYQRTVYDCLYVALAVALGGQLVTADQRLFHSLRTTPVASHLCWIEDVS